MPKDKKESRVLIVLGDQLSDRLAVFKDFDKDRDCVWMAEVSQESEYVWSSKPRTAIFLAAMRHFAAELEDKGITVHYRKIKDKPAKKTIGDALSHFLGKNKFDGAMLTHPGEYRLKAEIEKTCEDCDLPLEIYEDDSFLCTLEQFEEHADGRKQLRMEFFYREMRKRHAILVGDDDKPEGGEWNFDSENRKSFGKDGPENLFSRSRFKPDSITKEVIEEVNTVFEDHPGSLVNFDWPICRSDALKALREFIKNELPQFGPYQDAMWMNEPFLNHSLLSSSINLKLLNPKEAIDAAVEAFEKGNAPLASVEGFVRQILGWREYVRGIYWMKMPDYLDGNELEAEESLPKFYWTAETDMNCLQQAVSQTLEYGYAHHIQRLMVTGLYALLLGVKPKEVHEWYLAVYIDAVEWVELPNTLGMSQYADGGIMASKPYVATGKYIKRMSNYCDSCRYNPEKRTGDDACPFTTLYWDFLDRHQSKLSENPRMNLQVRNLEKVSKKEMKEIRERAKQIKQGKHS